MDMRGWALWDISIFSPRVRSSILPRATSSSAGQTEENKLRALSYHCHSRFHRILPPLKGPPTLMSPESPTLGEGAHPDWPGGSRYDLDEIDAYWLELLNSELKEMGR